MLRHEKLPDEYIERLESEQQRFAYLIREAAEVDAALRFGLSVPWSEVEVFTWALLKVIREERDELEKEEIEEHKREAEKQQRRQRMRGGRR